MDTHRGAPAQPNRTRKNDMMLRLSDAERESLDRVAERRGASRSNTIRALIIEEDARTKPKRGAR